MMVHRIHSRKEAARFMPSSLRRVLWAAAVLPPVLLLLYIYRKDRVEKEPPRLLLRLFLGGCLAVLPAMALELAGLRVSLRLFQPGSLAESAFRCFVAVGAVEEGCKFFFLRTGSWRNPAFNYRFDALVYAVFVSMGFALVENILYVAGDGTMATALMRGVTAIPGHAAFAVFMGYCYGVAKMYGDAAGRCTDIRQAQECQILSRRFLQKAVWLPALLHGFYDFCLEVQLPLMGAAFVAFVIALDLMAVRQIRRAGRSDARV